MSVNIFQIIREAIQQKIVFTDMKIQNDAPIAMKTAMGWRNVSEIFKGKADVPSYTDVEDFIKKLCPPNWRDALRERGALDIAKTLGGIARLRASVFETMTESFINEDGDNVEGSNALTVVIRKLPVEIPEFDELGLPNYILKYMRERKGLWIFAGETGNGKSTSIASFLDYVNGMESKHILTLEQPIEYLFTSKKCIITQREVGVNIPDFATGLHNALRQRPDYILIGEVRDDDTFNTMLQAAESGHMILATFHTKSVPDAINKMLNLGKDTNYKAHTISNILEGVIVQKLVPSISGDSFVLAYEIMIPDAEMRTAIKKGETHRLLSLMETGKDKKESITLNKCLIDLIAENKISDRQALQASNDPENFKELHH